jgi:hypothetical protein
MLVLTRHAEKPVGVGHRALALDVTGYRQRTVGVGNRALGHGHGPLGSDRPLRSRRVTGTGEQQRAEHDQETGQHPAVCECGDHALYIGGGLARPQQPGHLWTLV